MRKTIFSALLLLAGLAAPLAVAAEECDNGSFDGTFELIQQAIFERRGCAEATCHGAAAAGGLDLRPDVAYDNLISAPAQTVPPGRIPGLKRVVPGQKDQSLLFLNLAAATLPAQWTAPLRAMPLGLDPLTVNELEALREWIEQGAPRTGTVPGTGELLDACLPPAKPIDIDPLEPPAPGTGVQVRMPKWVLPKDSETEVCFVSYYDVSDQVPAEYRGPNGDTFRYNTNQIRQDPLSHHLIITYYAGMAAPDDPIWGEFRCRGGEREGESCEPTDLEFCGSGLCGSEPKRAVACNGFGPGDRDTAGRGFAGTQEASSQRVFPAGVFGEAPLKGLLIWNSHAFNLTDEDGKLEAWVNFEFAPPTEQISLVRGIFNTGAIFSMNVPAFAAAEVCNFNQFPDDTRLFELNSHTHKRGKRFRTFLGRWACQGGANDGAACSPFGPDTSFETPDICAGAPCGSPIPPALGDCNGDGKLTVTDLVTGVALALRTRPFSACRAADGDGDREVSVAELVQMVRTALEPLEYRNAEDSLLYTNFVYNDPTVLLFDPPMPLSGSSIAARTLTYCALYDNGYADPDEVKSRSTSPPTPLGVPGLLGGPCVTPTGCTAGRVGEACSGANTAARDASCDSSPGAGDGICDACPLRGGVTTEDEMFILMGAYYVD
jgi:hypothetical protein